MNDDELNLRARNLIPLGWYKFKIEKINDVNYGVNYCDGSDGWSEPNLKPYTLTENFEFDLEATLEIHRNLLRTNDGGACFLLNHRPSHITVKCLDVENLSPIEKEDDGSELEYLRVGVADIFYEHLFEENGTLKAESDLVLHLELNLPRKMGQKIYSLTTNREEGQHTSFSVSLKHNPIYDRHDNTSDKMYLNDYDESEVLSSQRGKYIKALVQHFYLRIDQP